MYLHLTSILFISSLIFIISLLLLTLDFVLFLILVGDKLGCLFEICLVFLRMACITMNFPLRTALAASHRFLYGCIFLVICRRVCICLCSCSCV